MLRPVRVVVVGAGLAGSEAAWQLAERGVEVRLYEMKPVCFSPAHHSPELAELVCSNSLRAAGLGNAVGLLKEEMRRLGSLVLRAADATAVPAGRALAVELRREELCELPSAGLVVLATGPLTSASLAAELQGLVGERSLYFYDAISPIVYADSLDTSRAFRASRWEDGDGDYWNLPLDRAQYEDFVAALSEADTVPLHAFEAALYFEGCLPIEEMARRGVDTLRFGPLKSVGLRDPETGRWPHAVVQLRHEDKRGVLLNLVGFQTKLRVAEQQRILRSLPGLADAVFARYGSVHRNTFVNSPSLLSHTLELHARPGLLLAGQIAGVEGYVESAALGLVAGVNAAFLAHGLSAPEPEPVTAHGALLQHLRTLPPRDFQPTNVNFGLFPPLPGAGRLPRPEKNLQLAERALAALEHYRAAAAPEVLR
jgi:methylenetetrahydrofolate--tRNA-(uracil-5-)-methyltransferase